LVFPFGFFPNQKKRNAGLIIPAFGEDATLGFSLKDGGFYWPINDNLDTKFMGSIFSGGSWGLENLTRYKKRYKREGDISLSYTKNKVSDPEYPDYREQSNFWVSWNHRQNTKAHPYNNFNARINAGTSTNFTNNINSTSAQYLTNQFNSNINFTRSFAGKPFNLAVGANHNQNTSTGVVNVTLPSMSFNVNRFYVAKWFNPEGTKRSKFWKSLEKIGSTFRFEGINKASLQDTLLALNNMNYISNNIQNGFKHTTSINTSLRLLKSRLTFTPSASWVGRYYFKKSVYDTTGGILVKDTLDGFFYNDNYSMTGALTTKIYGYYKMVGPKKREFRHVLTPNLTFNYRPDFDQRQRVSFTDTSGTQRTFVYNPFAGAVYGTSPSGESGRLSLNLINTLDMKVKAKLDSTGTPKKVKIIENFNISTGYDFIADSLNLSNFRMSGRTTLFKIFNINASSDFDPYWYDETGLKRDVFNINETGKLFRLNDANLAAGFRFSSKQKKGKELSEEEEDDITGQNKDPFDFIDVPWTVTVNYSIRYNRQFFSEYDPITDITESIDSIFYTQTLRFSGDFNLSPNWRINFNSGYDFINKDVTFTNIGIERDLNCWSASFNWIPFGDRRSYSLTIQLKNPLLRDVKYTRQRSWFDQDFF